MRAATGAEAKVISHLHTTYNNLPTHNKRTIMSKSQDDLKKEQEEAKAKLDALLNQTKPKNLRQGLGTGVNNVIAGAVGGAGVAVIAPTLGFAAGLKNGGILGAAFGAAGGAIVGALGAVALVAGGAISGGKEIGYGI